MEVGRAPDLQQWGLRMNVLGEPDMNSPRQQGGVADEIYTQSMEQSLMFRMGYEYIYRGYVLQKGIPWQQEFFRLG